MRYNELRDTLLRALRDSRFRVIGRPSETIDLTTTTRRYETFLEDVAVQRAEPFYVAASVTFQWDPFESTRTYTNEDDLISELLGRDEETLDTMPPCHAASGSTSSSKRACRTRYKCPCSAWTDGGRGLTRHTKASTLFCRRRRPSIEADPSWSRGGEALWPSSRSARRRVRFFCEWCLCLHGNP